MKAKTHPLAAPGGFFLRAETMHAYLAEIDASDADGRAWGGEKLHHRSHGESFLAVLRHRFADRGVYFLDEPESALSFRSSLALLIVLDALREEGSQVIMSTHSPLLAALPGAGAARAAEGEDAGRLRFHARVRVADEAAPGGFQVQERPVAWEAERTAIIICDMWDAHWCQGATGRAVEIAPRLNEFAREARRRGVLVVHAPSSCMEAYQDHPARKRAQAKC